MEFSTSAIISNSNTKIIFDKGLLAIRANDVKQTLNAVEELDALLTLEKEERYQLQLEMFH